MANTYTLQDALNICYGLISQGQDSNDYPTVLMTSFLNKAQNDICYGNIVNLTTNERIEKQALTFLEKTTYHTTVNYATTSSTATVGSTTLNISGTLNSSGYVWINGAIISYTGKTTTQLTGIPTSGDGSIPFAFPSGTRIFQLYAMPTDFGQSSRAFLTINGNSNREKLISVDSRDLNTPIPGTGLYNFFNTYNQSWNGSDQEWYYSMLRGSYLLYLVPQIAGQPICFEYQKAPTQMVNVYDLLTIPENYSLNTIPYMAVSEMLANRGETDEAMRLNNFGFNNIKSMYQFYATQRSELLFDNRVRTVSDGGYHF